MAHKKGAGSTKNGRDSNSKRLGVKIYDGTPVVTGNMIVRQRGLKIKAGNKSEYVLRLVWIVRFSRYWFKVGQYEGTIKC